MLVDLFSFVQKERVGSLDLSDEVFGLESRQDIIKLVIDHQRIKKISGTRSVKNLSEVSGTGKKPFAQKGTGNARRGTNRAPHMRGGALAHQVSTNSGHHKINKKVRYLGLSHSLSLKLSQSKLFVVDSLYLDNHKTTNLLDILSKYRNHSTDSVLIIDAAKTDVNLFHAARNLHNVTTVCRFGANVYDVIKHNSVIICKDAIKMITDTAEKVRYCYMNAENYYDLIRSPIYTEKSNSLMERNKYTFKVLASANKYEVSRAVKNIFNVEVRDVNIINVSGASRRFKSNLGRTSSFKKAIVTLENGYKIDYNLLQLKEA